MGIVSFIILLVVWTVWLWVAMKVTKEEGPFLALLAAAFIAAVIDLLPIPYVGWLLPSVVLVVLISKWTTAEIFPDAVLIVLVAQLLRLLAIIALKLLKMRLV